MAVDNYLGKNLDNPQIWKDGGNNFFNEGQYEEAIKCYKHAIQLNPNYIDAWNNLGLTFLKIGKIEDAKRCNEIVKKLKTGYTPHESDLIFLNLSVKSENFSITNQYKDYNEIKKKYENGVISYDMYQKMRNDFTKTISNDNQPNIDNTGASGKSAMNFCNYCGAELKFRDAEICPNCGMRLRETREKKSPGLAALLSFLIPGLGHVYNGEVGKGILFLLGRAIGSIFFIIPGIIVAIFDMYYAYKTSKEMNEGKIPFKKSELWIMILYAIIVIIVIFIAIIIIAAVIAAFMFGLAGTTVATKNVGVTVSTDKDGLGIIEITGGSDLENLVSLKYSIDGGDAYPVKATNSGRLAPTATEIGVVGKRFYTGEPVKGKRLLLIASFKDGVSQVIYDRYVY